MQTPKVKPQKDISLLISHNEGTQARAVSTTARLNERDCNFRVKERIPKKIMPIATFSGWKRRVIARAKRNS